jgi:trigger factor
MRVLSSKRKGHTVSLEIEESTDNIEDAFTKAFKRLVKSSKIPGFRQGKAPRHVFEKHYGKKSIVNEAILDIVNDAYRNAIDELSLKVIDYPKNMDISEYQENAPLSFKCDVDVVPEVKLGKYKSLKVKKESADVSSDLVEQEINMLLEKYAEYKEVDRPAQDDDILRCNIKATFDDTVYAPWTRNNTAVRIGVGAHGKDFDTQLVGAEKGKTAKFEVSYEADHKLTDVAGKTVSFEIDIEGISEKQLPELDDAFAAKISEFKTATELREKIKTSMEEESVRKSEEKLKVDLLDIVVENIKVDVPEAMVTREIDNSIKHLESQVKQSGSSLENYLSMTGKSMDALRTDVGKDAEKRVKSDLALDAIAEKETITAETTDIEEEIGKWNMPEYKSVSDLEKDPRVDLENIKSIIRKRKTYDYLIDNAKISK